MDEHKLDDDAEEEYLEALERHRVEIVRCLDLDRQFMLSYLRSNRVFDDEDCQIILNAGPSRQQKAAKFLDTLISRGRDAYDYFVKGLEFEHAHLYQVMTGSPPVKDSMYHQSNSTVGTSWILAEKQLMDFDREFLLKELKKQAEQYQRLLYVHDKTMKEKLSLEEELTALNETLQAKESTLEELRMELVTRREVESSRAENVDIHAFSVYCQDLVRSNVEKNEAIIALQARLLARNERMERANKLIDELKRKNENLMQQVRDLTINYDLERTESRKKADQLRQVTNAKEDLYKIKFDLAKMTEERDEAVRKLDDFKNVACALTARHDWLEKEAREESSKRDEVSERYRKLQKHIRDLKGELTLERSSKENLTRKVKRLTSEVDTFKEQREFLVTERRNAITERDRALQEKEDALRRCKDIQKSRDEAVQKHINVVAVYEEKYDNISKQLDEQRHFHCPTCSSIRSSSFSETEPEISIVSPPATSPSATGKFIPVWKTIDESIPGLVDDNDEEQKNMLMKPTSPFSWSERRNTEVIDSIRRRVEKKVPVSDQTTSSSLSVSSPQNESMQWPFNRLIESRSPVATFFEDPFNFMSQKSSSSTSSMAASPLTELTPSPTEAPIPRRSLVPEETSPSSDPRRWSEDYSMLSQPSVKTIQTKSPTRAASALERRHAVYGQKPGKEVRNFSQKSRKSSSSTKKEKSCSVSSLPLATIIGASTIVKEIDDQCTFSDSELSRASWKKLKNEHPPLRRLTCEIYPPGTMPSNPSSPTASIFRPLPRERANDIDRTDSCEQLKKRASVEARQRRSSEPAISFNRASPSSNRNSPSAASHKNSLTEVTEF